MPLAFSHPAALWFLPAAALPIIFHLFFRLRRQVQDFPSLMFFMRIDPRLSSKRKIHEWLILLLRCLFLALVFLALARPLLGVRGAGGDVARVILIDNSGSIAEPTRVGVSKLALAREAAAQLVISSRPGDAVTVQLAVPDPIATLPQGLDASPAALRDGLGKLTASDGTGSMPRAIRLALATLATARQPQHELHIITDLQKTNWSRGDMGGDSLPPNCRIIVHRLATAPLTAGSVSLELTGTPTRSLPAGRITPVRALLKNQGPESANVRLNATDDSGKNTSRDVVVPAGATVPTALTFSFADPGFHFAQVWVEGDAAPTANHASVGFWCTTAQKVLFVGQRQDFGALPFAVSPGGNADLSGIEAVFVGANELSAQLALAPLAVVVTWNNWPQDGSVSEALHTYVRKGGTLFVAPAPETGVTVPTALPKWIDASPGTLYTSPEPEPVLLLQDGDAIWRDLQDSDGRPTLGLLRALQYRGLKTTPDWQALASSSKGSTLLARRTLEQGRLFASGLAFIPKWSSLPLKAGFVVLIQNALFGNETEHLPVQALSAGEEFHFDLPGGKALVQSLAGSALAWQGQARDFAGFPRSGVYEIKQDDQVNWVAASANPEEANADFLPSASIPLLHNLPHEVVALTNNDDVTRLDLSQDSGLAIYRWLMLAALLVLLAETWLANERSSDLGRKMFGSLLPPPRQNSAHRETAGMGRR